MLALVRAPHQLISRKDMMPTPSQPIMSWYMLFAVIIMIMATRNIVRYLINLLMCGSSDIYQAEKLIMDQVINSATGVKVSDSVSSVREGAMFSVVNLIRGVGVSVVSQFLLSRVFIGIRLTKNNSISLFLVRLGLNLLEGRAVDMISDRSTASVIEGTM